MLFFLLNDKKFSSHMAQISEHIKSLNHKIHSYDKMIKIIVNLGSKKCEDNNNYTRQLNQPQNLLIMSIFDTPEKDISKVDRKLDKIKIRKYSIKSSSIYYFLVPYVQCII